MSQRFEYVIKDKNGEAWSAYAPRTVEDAWELVAAMNATEPRYAPFSVWERVITETPLAPGAPETAP